jgi:hypothetical protein
LRKGLCAKTDRDKCVEEFDDGPALDWNCKNCPKKRAQDLSQWTLHLLRIRRLQTGGYPFRANDLDIETWMDLGVVNEWLRTPVL